MCCILGMSSTSCMECECGLVLAGWQWHMQSHAEMKGQSEGAFYNDRWGDVMAWQRIIPGIPITEEMQSFLCEGGDSVMITFLKLNLIWCSRLAWNCGFSFCLLGPQQDEWQGHFHFAIFFFLPKFHLSMFITMIQLTISQHCYR